MVHLRKHIKSNPRDAKAFYYAGLSYKKLGQLQSAQAMFKKAIAIAPGSQAAKYSKQALTTTGIKTTSPPSKIRNNKRHHNQCLSVIHAKVNAPVRLMTQINETGTITFPIPGRYRNQFLLCFFVRSNPGGSVIDYKLKQIDKLNCVCEVKVRPPAQGTVVSWEGIVLVNPRAKKILPKAAKSVFPANVKAWTRSTACVQSSDKAIRARAQQLSNGTKDVESYVAKVIDFTRKNTGTGAKFDALDARKALDCGGSCTSKANLAAALLRAKDIPARTIAHLPTWSGPLYEHWLVEYWHPGAGWIWVESSMAQYQPTASDIAVLAVSSPEDEDKAFDPLHLRFVMPGAPYMSVAELSEELTYAPNFFKDDGMNKATKLANYDGSKTSKSRLIKLATLRHAQLLRSTSSKTATSENQLMNALKMAGNIEALSTVTENPLH